MSISHREEQTDKSSQPKKIQIRLSTLILAMVIAALGIALVVNRLNFEAELERLEVRIQELDNRLTHSWIEKELITLKQERANMQVSVGTSHPKMVELNKRIQVLEQHRLENLGGGKAVKPAKGAATPGGN